LRGALSLTKATAVGHRDSISGARLDAGSKKTTRTIDRDDFSGSANYQASVADSIELPEPQSSSRSNLQRAATPVLHLREVPLR
jgi:hypothetical protein